MKHLVATSIAAHSVPCFPPQPLLFSISRGLYRGTSSSDRPKRSRKPNQKYNPEEYDLSTDQVKLRVKSRRTIRRAK